MNIQGDFTKNIKISDYQWADDKGVAILTPTSLKFILCFDEWIKWVKRKVVIHGMYRSEEYNKKVGGIANSNHTNGTAVDFHINGLQMDSERFIKYATKWKAICKKHGFVGEAGIYNWGMHFGVQTYSKTFFNWDSRSGKQINNAFQI